MSCQHCLNRREFLARSAMAAALAVAQGCGDGQIGPSEASVQLGGSINVADFPGLGSTGTLVDVGGDRAVIRTGPSSFDAFSMVCTHEGCETSVKNNRFECPCHGSVFANTGAVVVGPATRPLDHIPVTFDSSTGKLTFA
ncbi:MAG TPA: ubiquinol-cytochrome c reductase iron-sulfur subunit [Gemmatimonadaceae bacterium]|jgi:Rieske Fe-S protein|nr:ubiquinol-cytochrome c reductase iron-sulfur subunit [Gemmatimonadaceae bacterium]